MSLLKSCECLKRELIMSAVKQKYVYSSANPKLERGAGAGQHRRGSRLFFVSAFDVEAFEEATYN
jgi:hypothetical protein